jgi:glycine cleavage system transcriptional repressor
MTHFAVTAVGADRPGIVAAVTRTFVDHGCNLEDSSMTILRGQFAMMLVVDAPPSVTAAELEEALAVPAGDLDLVVTVRPAPDDATGVADSGTWTVSVHGADRPGIVHGVAALLAERSVNIVDLSTRVVGPADHALYTMVLEVTLPAGADAPALEAALDALAGELGVTCRLHPSDADIL